MPINTSELMNVAATLSEQHNLRVAVVQSLKAGFYAGGTTVIGGLLFGPPGLAIGGIVGGCTAAIMNKNKFRSVADIIKNDMTYEQQQRLASSIRNVISDICVEDAALLLPLILNNQVCQREILHLVTEFLTREMSLQIID